MRSRRIPPAAARFGPKATRYGNADCMMLSAEDGRYCGLHRRRIFGHQEYILPLRLECS